jgi:Arc/MetJ family transcription regulator
MRTNIDIDDDLLTEAITASGLSTKKATVEEALRVSCNGTAGGQRWST